VAGRAVFQKHFVSLAVLGLWVCASAASAEDFGKFGRQPNVCPTIHGGVCAAASAINSFIYLENQYPTRYGTKLTPNMTGAVGAQTDQTDTNSFATLYYSQTGNPMDDFLADKESWINSRAPGSTAFDSEYLGSKQNNSNPTIAFLQSQENDNEDVELFVFDVSNPKIAHVIDLTSVTCTPAGGCVIKTQDPNSPNQQQTQQVTTGAGGALQITGLPGTGAPYLTDMFQIYAAFAESPAPEPEVWALLVIGLGAVGAALRRSGGAVVPAA
jgi:hypothetical protein